MLREASPHWIRSNVLKLISEIDAIANAMLVKPGLPDLPPELSSQLVREAILDELSTALGLSVRLTASVERASVPA